MARPHRSRCICSLPTICEFSPKTGPTVRKNIIMTVDEYEVIRLIDLLELTQEECALQLEVSRTTVTAIYTAARRKLAQAIIEGEPLLIQGGNITVCSHTESCSHYCCKVPRNRIHKGD